MGMLLHEGHNITYVLYESLLTKLHCAISRSPIDSSIGEVVLYAVCGV